MKSPDREPCSGVTLIEVLTSITISCFIVALLYHGLKMGQSQWTHTQSRTEITREMLAGIQLLERDLSSIVSVDSDIPTLRLMHDREGVSPSGQILVFFHRMDPRYAPEVGRSELVLSKYSLEWIQDSGQEVPVLKRTILSSDQVFEKLLDQANSQNRDPTDWFQSAQSPISSEPISFYLLRMKISAVDHFRDSSSELEDRMRESDVWPITQDSESIRTNALPEFLQIELIGMERSQWRKAPTREDWERWIQNPPEQAIRHTIRIKLR